MKLIIFSGLPGTGKSTLAEAVGRAFRIPVFAKDWLEATLIRSELIASNQNKPPGYAGYQLLTTLAERKFMLGQSAILDSVAGTKSIQDTWRQLAGQYGADCRVIECICSDESLHCSRLKERKRNIPGWHELEWSEVERVSQYYSAWEGEHLVLDMTNSFNENFLKAKTYCD
jgi:predicted kinase